MTLDAQPDVADTRALYRKYLAATKRVEPGALVTRDWAKWNAEHPYLKKGRHHDYVIEGLGTKEHPFKTSDPAQAAKLLYEGHHVELDQPRQVSTLMSRLHELVTEAAARGEEAHNIDLCRVSVPGTNLFCAHNIGIPRLKMPQLSGKPIPGSKADKLEKDAHGEVNLADAFIEHLRSKGVSVTDSSVSPSFLRASQAELDGPKVASMYRAVQAHKLPASPIFVSKDDYVIDGHHRWAAEAAADYDDGIMNAAMAVHQVDMPISEILTEALAFQQEMGIAAKGVRIEAGWLDTRSWAVFDAMRPHHPRVKHAVETAEQAKQETDPFGWHPTMTPAEADAWLVATGSKVKKPLFHGTQPGNVPRIKRTGFATRPSAKSTSFAQHFGQGAYLTEASGYAFNFSGQNPAGVLETRIAVHNPASSKETHDIVEAVKARKPPVEQIPVLVREEAERRGFDAISVNDYYARRGSRELTPTTNYVVFDPHNIVVVAK